MTTAYAYPSDVSDEEWAFVLPYLLLSTEDSGARRHPLRAVFAAYRYLLRAGCGWRMLPGNFPPWKAVYDQAARWHAAGVFEALPADLRGMIRLGEGRAWSPSAAVLDSRTLKSTASSEDATYDGAKRVKGRKLHLAVDTLGHLLAAVVSPADVQDRAMVARLCAEMQAEVEGTITAAFVDQGYTGGAPAHAAAAHGVELLVVKHAGPKRGFVLLPRRWVVERTFAWMTNFRRLNRDYERLAETLRALHVSAHAMTLLARAMRDQRRGTRPKPSHPLAILKSVEGRFSSSLHEIRQLVQADLFDSELNAAKELAKQKFTRAAGALAGVVLERHLAQVCDNHALTIPKKAPGIADLNNALKEAGVVDVPQWRFVQHLADIRNLCDHSKSAEPTKEQVDDLLSGVQKITKTLF